MIWNDILEFVVMAEYLSSFSKADFVLLEVE